VGDSTILVHFYIMSRKVSIRCRDIDTYPVARYNGHMVNHLFIQKLRKQKGLSQAYVASSIGVSRPTYIALEQGKRELSITEAKKLADLFNITLDQLIASENTFAATQLEPEKKEKVQAEEMRISVPQENAKKFKEVLLYILNKVGSKSNIGETVLYKLLYFIDFDYYEKYEEQLIGAQYIKNHFGPTPVMFAKIVKRMEENGELETVKSKYFQHDQKKYLPHRAADLSVFSAREKELIDEVLIRLSDKNAKELSEYSHKDIPWMAAEMGKPMSYESVFYRDDKYSVRSYDDEL
jgi:transcriptional regulator with XRE-family HTH domain